MRPAASSSAIAFDERGSSSSSTAWPSSRATRASSPASTRRPPERVVGHVAVGVAEVDAVGVERRAERAAGIAGRRRHEHALEAGLGEDARVGDAVQRHAAAEAEIRQAGLAMQRARDVDQHVLEHALHAGGAVGEALPFGGREVDRVVRAARRAEQLDEPRRIRAAGRGLELEIVQVERERAVGRAANQLAHLRRPSSDGRRRRGPSPCIRPRSPRSRDRR